MVKSKDLLKNIIDFVLSGGARPFSVRLAYVRNMFDSVVQRGQDLFDASKIGWAAKSSTVAFFDVVHERPVTNSASKWIAAIDKSTPLRSFDLKRHLTLTN
jgi:hypothetical protein